MVLLNKIWCQSLVDDGAILDTWIQCHFYTDMS